MSDVTYERFMKRWEEVTDLPPQSLGPLTGVYKRLTRKLKVMPWPWFFAVSLIVAGGLYILLGSTITRFVSLLQGGF